MTKLNCHNCKYWTYAMESYCSLAAGNNFTQSMHTCTPLTKKLNQIYFNRFIKENKDKIFYYFDDIYDLSKLTSSPLPPIIQLLPHDAKNLEKKFKAINSFTKQKTNERLARN